MKPTIQLTFIITLLFLFLSSLSFGQRTQQDFESALCIEGAVKAFERNGYNLYDPVIGAMISDRYTIFPVSISAGNSYVFGVCADSSVDDLDLALLDMAGNVLAQDTRDSKVGVVEYQPRRSGSYLIRIDLYETSSDAASVSFLYGYK